MKQVRRFPVSLLPLESAHPLLCAHQLGHSSQFGHLPGDVVTQSPQLPVGLAVAVPPVGLDRVGWHVPAVAASCGAVLLPRGPPCFLLTRPSLQQPLTFYWCRSPAFSRTPWSWSHTMHRACRVGHLFRQASLTWQFAFEFLPCLFIPRWFMSFFVLNNIPLSGGARGYLSIHQLENILLPSNFRQLRIKLRYAPV